MNGSTLICLLYVVCIGQVTGFWFSPKSVFDDDWVHFRLYTRETSEDGELFGRDYGTAVNSQFDPNRPTKIFLHGWFAAGWNWYITDLRMALLENEDLNFIEVDWSLQAANPNYLQAKVSAQDAGVETAKLITWLSMFFGLKLEDVHVIGHSLGAQASGALGRELQNPKIGRISGLDPAQPGFNLSNPEDTLGPEDADFVDILHTTITAKSPMGHADFYPNNGELGIRYLTWFHAHMQAVYIYTETINSKCPFTAYKCDNFDQVLDDMCPKNCDKPETCNRMGYHASPTGALGNLQLEISEGYPYC